MKHWKIFLYCRIWKWHKWTSAAQEGIKPTKEQTNSLEGFYEYATMYCSRCGHISKYSKQLLCKYKDSE